MMTAPTAVADALLRSDLLDTAVIVIPSYEPDARLVHLVEELRFRVPGCEILVVDDGSGPRYARVFEQAVAAGALLIGTPENAGKAQALRSGFSWVLRERPGYAVICADSDGQHRVHDILRVADVLGAYGESEKRSESEPAPMVVLGGRRFTGSVPARSRFGNTLSRVAFRFATGRAITDTQTGLRGYPAAALPWLLSVRGERFAYELQILLDAASRGFVVEEVPIDTVYLDENASSHFRPIVDSVRVLLPLLLYGASSFLSFLLDTAVLLLLDAVTNSVFLSVVGARLVSAGGNFALNRQVVFRRHRSSETTSLPFRSQLLRYVTLAAVMLAANVLALTALTALGLPLLGAKVVTEVLLYLVSFQVQRVLVFGRARRNGRGIEQVTMPTQTAVDGAAMLTSQVMPNGSLSMPKESPHGATASGCRTAPPSASRSK